MKLVKIGRQGQKITEYMLNDSPISVQDVLNKAGIYIAADEDVTMGETILSVPYTLQLSTGDVVLVKPKQLHKINIKIGRVGERLFAIELTPGTSAFGILSTNGLSRRSDEKVFLKKVNDSHYDEDITSREYSYIPIDGDILVIEKIRIQDPRVATIKRLIENLDNAGHIEYFADDKVLEDYISIFLKNNIL